MTDGPQGRVTYGDIYLQNEREQSAFNFEHANTDELFGWFETYGGMRKARGAQIATAYEMTLNASHTFNLLDARHAVSVTERQRHILRVRTMARSVAQAYHDSREALGFPLIKSSNHSEAAQ